MFKEERALVANHITTVSDHNEITNHLLQVFVAHNIRQKGILSSNEVAQVSGRAPGANPFTGREASRANVEYSRIVLDLMKEVTKKQRFAHKNDLWTICQNQMTNAEFINSLNSLMDDGAIYTAIDDDQFAITE